MASDSPTTDPVIVIQSFGGQCPNQIEGTVLGKPFYFRARWHQWVLRVQTNGEQTFGEWEIVGGVQDEDAGWYTDEEAMAVCVKALVAYVNKVQNREG